MLPPPAIFTVPVSQKIKSEALSHFVRSHLKHKSKYYTTLPSPMGHSSRESNGMSSLWSGNLIHAFLKAYGSN